MDLLIVGGTRFVGRHITAAALARGHRVTLLHRGLTQSPGLEAADHLLADRDDLGSALEGRAFDATIDVCAYWPRQVRSLAAALGGRGGHYVYISSISAYADTSALGGDESLPLATIDADDPGLEDLSALIGEVDATWIAGSRTRFRLQAERLLSNPDLAEDERMAAMADQMEEIERLDKLSAVDRGFWPAGPLINRLLKARFNRDALVRGQQLPAFLSRDYLERLGQRRAVLRRPVDVES